MDSLVLALLNPRNQKRQNSQRSTSCMFFHALEVAVTQDSAHLRAYSCNGSPSVCLKSFIIHSGVPPNLPTQHSVNKNCCSSNSPNPLCESGWRNNAQDVQILSCQVMSKLATAT